MFNLFTTLTMLESLKLIGFSLVIVFLFQFSNEFYAINAADTFFLGIGFALAIVIVAGSRYLISVFTGVFIAIVLHHQPIWLATCLGITNSLAVYWGGHLFNKANRQQFSLRSVGDFSQLLFYGVVCVSGLSALLQTGLLAIAGRLSIDNCLHNLLYCWMGNALGMILIMPLTLAWLGRCTDFKQTQRQKVQLLVISLLVLLVTQCVFSGWQLGRQLQHISGYLLIPLIVWIALLADARFMSLLLTIVGVQGIMGIYLDHGLFNHGDALQNRLLEYWFYQLTIGITGFALMLYANRRKWVEKSLLENQNRFKTLVNNSSILVWICGTNKRCFYFNQVWLDFTGKTLEQEIGDGWLDGIHPDDRRHYLDTFMTAFDSQDPFAMEYRLACVDGTHHWMLDHGAPRFDEQGKFLGFIGTLVDISSRKFAENTLGFRTKELTLQNKLLKQISSGIGQSKLLTELVRQMETLLPDSLCSILIMDDDGHRLLSGAACSLPDFFLESLNGLIIGEGRGSCGTAAYRGERVVIDNVHKHPYWTDFREVCVAIGIETCWSEPIITQNGRVLGTLAIYYKQPKQPSTAECSLVERYASLAQLTIEHKQYEDALQESEERLRFVLEGSELGFWDWQIKQNVVQRNAIWAEILGYKQYEIKNSVQNWLDLVYLEDKAKAWQSVKDVLNGRADIHEIEYRMYHKDGSLKWIHDHAKVVQRDTNGIPIRMSGTHTDITKIKKAEEELRIAAIAFDCQEGMFVTDTKKTILRINHAFTKITGFTEVDALRYTPKLFQSGLQSPSFYQDMWGQIHGTGEWKGEIWNRRKSGEIFPAWLTVTAVNGNNKEITHYVATMTDITTRKLAEEKIAKLAFYDALTHLPNRRLLMEHLEHSIAVSKRDVKLMAVFMLDLDKFKAVNDGLGHQAGDELLQQVAQRLSARLRDVDMVARLGGDEFIVLLDDIKNAEAAGQVAANIVEDLSSPFTLSQNNVVRIGVSIGISMCPQNSDLPETLLEQADIALYQAKNRGRGRFSYYTGNLASEAQFRTVMEKRLSRAIEQQELRLVYQAQVEARSNKIIGTEVFVRWKNPIDGLTPLHRFIPIAEESGLIISIGTWVLREACRQGRFWLDNGFKPLSIAVNISPLQFRQTEISEVIAKILMETGFPAKYLTLEITESALIVNQDYAVETLNKLHRLGIRLAIDDFGTGYSSLTYLKRFPLDILKIDKRFVAEITNAEDDTEIASTLITMGHTLGYKTLAEGVETQEQLKFLQEKGCDMYQGYLKSRPLSAERFADLVKSQLTTD